MPPQVSSAPGLPDPASFPDQAASPGPGTAGARAATPGSGTPDPASFPDQPKAPDPQKPKTGPQGSALSRYGSALYEGTVGAIPNFVGQAATNFSEQGFLGGLGETAMGVLGVRPMTEHIAQATEARRKGDWGGWLHNMILSIPVAGPIGESVGGKLQEGDLAGAAGEVTALGAPSLLGKASKFLPPSIKRPPSKIPLTAAERGSKVPGVQYAQALTERTIPGSIVFKKFRERQQVALRQLGEAAADRISNYKGTASEVGTAVQQALTLGRDALKDHASELYAAIDEHTQPTTVRVKKTETVPGRVLDARGNPTTTTKTTMEKQQVGGVMPETITLKKAVVPLLRRLKEQEQLMDPNLLSSYRTSLEHILKAPAKLSFKAFQDTRSDLLKIVRAMGDPVPGKKAGLAKHLAQITDDAMMKAAEQSGIPDLPFLVRTANDAWRDLKEVYNDSFMKKLKNASPETVTALMRKADVDDLTLLKRGVSRTTWEAASARVMRDVLEGATEPPPSTGVVAGAQHTLTHGATPPTTPVVGGHKIHSQLQKLGTERADALFGAQGHRDLLEIADLAEKVDATKSQAMIPGLIAGGVNVAVMAPFLRVAPSLLSVAGTTAATFYTLAKILTTQPGRVAYRDFVRAVGSGKRPLAVAAGLRVMSQMDKQGAPESGDGSAPEPTTPGPGGRAPLSSGAGAGQ